MIDPLFVIVRPTVGMRIELKQTYGPVHFGIGLKDGIGDIVIAAQCDRGDPCGKKAAHMRPQGFRKAGDVGVIECNITAIRNRKFAQDVKWPAIWRIAGLKCARLADRARAQSRAGTICDGLIEWHARHRDIHACEVFGIFAPHERWRTTEYVFETWTFEVLSRESVIDLGLRVFE